MTRLAGRDFTVQDRSGTARVAIVNESMARRFFPGGSPIGARFRIGSDTAPVEVVGLVRDARYESVRADAPPTVFLPGTQMPDDASADEFVIRTAVPPTSLVTPIRQIARAVSPYLNVTFETMTQRLDDDLARERLIATLATGFGLSGIALAMIGLYGVLGYLVAQRQSEFGLRLAIGAPPRSVLRLVMVEVLFVLVAGLAVGMAATLPATALLGTLLFDLQARDAGTLAGAALLLAIAVLLAGYLPARRATRIDPAEALRSE
jgi:hypothetical protein